MLQRTLYFLLFLGITFILLTWMYSAEKQTSILRLKKSELHHLESEAKTIQEIFRAITTDLHFLANLPELQNVDSVQYQREHLAKVFSSFSSAKRLYAQVRLLDTSGMEIIRIDRKNGTSLIISEKQLQNKVNRYYFQEAIRLEKHQVYVSPFDLNVEKGIVEKPLNPMIRFAEPIYDKKGNLQGVVVLNYHGAQLINTILNNREKHLTTFLVNRDSYFIIGPNPADEWGFMFQERRNKNMQHYYPKAWGAIKESSEGLILNKKGFFIHKTVYPFSGNIDSSNIQHTNGNNPYYWKIISYLPSEEFKEGRFNRYLKFYGIFFIISLMLSHIFVTLFEKNRDAQFKLRASFRLLQDKNSKLQKSNSTKNTFFSIIAHDLKNPIQVVMGYTGMLIENYHNMTIDEIKEYFKDIESATQKLLQLLENLLNWSRSQTDDIPFHPLSQEIQPVIETACQPTHMGMKVKNITLKISIPARLHAFIDKNLIITVIRNLVTNAIKFTPEGGIIRITAHPLGTDSTIVKVEDTGVGMSEEECSKLFQVDKKFSKSGTNGESGTGLGLILSKEFIQRSGGEITVESSEGEGSTFLITLPMHEFRDEIPSSEKKED